MNAPTTSYPALTGPDRIRAMLAVIIAGVILLIWVCRLVLIPVDPAGCVSVLTCQLGWFIIPVCAVVAFMLASLVCWISGGKLEELGIFGVALGLSLAALQYENASYLWASIGQGSDSLRKALAIDMALESVGWTIVVFAAYLGSQVTLKKLHLKPIISTDPVAEYRRGGLTVLFLSITALLLMHFLSSGTELAAIHTGQVYFACAVSFYLATWIAYPLTAARSPVWAYLAVAVVAVAGYTWTVYHATPSHPGRVISHLVHLSPTSFGRAQPIQMVMVSTAGAIFGNWHQRQLTRFAAQEAS